LLSQCLRAINAFERSGLDSVAAFGGPEMLETA
jgi:hypothetical protein